MLALEVRLLAGRYAATQFNDRRKAEWPPHPARVYSALVAALYDDPEHGQDERDALEWLAAAGPPDVIASEASRRNQPETYVPTNDASALTGIDRHLMKVREAESALERADAKSQKKARAKLDKALEGLRKVSVKSAEASGKGTPSNAAAVLPQGRSRQPRFFPVAIPDNPLVHLCWADPPTASTAVALDRVAARVVRLGHSSSLVSVRVVEEPGDLGDRVRWIPDEEGEKILRVPTEGQLQRLDEEHARHQQVEARVLPARFMGYADAKSRALEAETPHSYFATANWVVFEVVESEGSRRRLLDVSLAQHVARALRGTLMSAGGEEWPSVLTGHAAGGEPLTGAHLAFVPLAHVGHEHASGTILGVALVPPQHLDVDARDALSRAIGIAEAQGDPSRGPSGNPNALRLTMGRHGTVLLRRVRGLPSPQALQPERWTRPSKRWASATAIALDRNPGNLRSREPDVVERAVAQAEESVRRACTNIGLPSPVAVWVHARSLLTGAPAARRFMPFPSRGNGPKRVCVHAELVFDEPVAGPVILGAGRFFGVGLCAPISAARRGR